MHAFSISTKPTKQDDKVFAVLHTTSRDYKPCHMQLLKDSVEALANAFERINAAAALTS